MREEAASGKQMWNTALDRLSFERLQTRQMLRSMRSQLTDQMHSMINVGALLVKVKKDPLDLPCWEHACNCRDGVVQELFRV